MQEELSAKTIAMVKASAPVIAEHGVAITTAMYARLFKDEHIRALFNQANQGEGGAQVHALAGAILGYAQNIDNIGALVPVVERIAQKHIGYHILPEHYPFVATALLGAITDVLGDAASEELLAAWGEAYWFLANILKAREGNIRQEIENNTGGWHGWRAFRVAQKIQESAVITSFILRPVDRAAVMPHKPGQYLTFKFAEAGQPEMKRNYSISCAPNDEYYRISVKREDNGNGGSRYLHDQIQVGSVLMATPPAGEFFLPEQPRGPVVLLSGGVGLTPMVSMMETIAQHYPELETHYVHGTNNSSTHAMDDHMRSLAKRHENLSVTSFHLAPQEGDVAGQDFDQTGLITVDWLKENTPLQQADFYLCGPKPFLRAFVSGLSLAGVPSDRIHYEFFGPADALMSA